MALYPVQMLFWRSWALGAVVEEESAEMAGSESGAESVRVVNGEVAVTFCFKGDA